MKKTIMFLSILAMATMMAFAGPAADEHLGEQPLIGFGVGAAAFFRSPILIGQAIDLANLNVDQFSFGALGRFRFSLLQIEGLLLYSAGEISSLDIFLDVGIALDYSIFRLSLGAGPNFSNNFGAIQILQAGFNAKINFDVLIGPVSVGLSYLMALDIGSGIVVDTATGMLGVQFIFWL